MAVLWFPSDVVTTTSSVVHIHGSTAAVTGEPLCTCEVRNPGFACVAQRHATPDDLDLRAELRALERRAEYRDFVRHPPAPRAVVNREPRWVRTAPSRTHEWRNRVLGKRAPPRGLTSP